MANRKGEDKDVDEEVTRDDEKTGKEATLPTVEDDDNKQKPASYGS